MWKDAVEQAQKEPDRLVYQSSRAEEVEETGKFG